MLMKSPEILVYYHHGTIIIAIYFYSAETMTMNDRRGHGKLRLKSRKHFEPKPWHTVVLQRHANTYDSGDLYASTPAT